MLLMELPWPRLEQVIYIRTSTNRLIKIDQIDMRLETPQKEGIIQHIPVNWAAKLHNNTWLVGSGDGPYTTDASVQPHPPEDYVVLPDNWEDYVCGLYQDEYVKAAKDWQDRGEPSQETLDAVADKRKSFQSKLAEALLG